MTVLYSDNFDGYADGVLPAGFTATNGAWSVKSTNAPSGKGLSSDTNTDLLNVLYTATSLTDGSVTLDHKALYASGTGSVSTLAMNFRCSADYKTGYFLGLNPNDTVGVFKRVNGNYSTITEYGAIPNGSKVTWAVGDVLRQEVSFVSSLFEYRIWNMTAGQSRPATPTFSFTDASYASGFAGFTNVILNKNAPTGDNFVIADTNAVSGATSYTLNGPATAVVGAASSNFAVAMNGALSQDTTFTPSDGGNGGTFTPATLVIPAGSQNGTFTYTPASAGTKSISTTNNRSLTNPAATSLTADTGPVTIARTNAAIYYSPGNWCDDGTSRMSANPGAYLKFGFTGTSLRLLTTALTAMSAFPQLRAIVDGVEYNIGMSTATSFLIADGLPTGNHTVELYLRASSYQAGSWWNLVNALKITGFQIDAGATVTAPTTRPKIVYCFGDSLTQGFFIDSLSTPSGDDALGNYVSPLAEALNAEYAQIGWGGTNWTVPGVGDVPGFSTSYALVAAGYSRLTGGLFTVQPDYITVMLGTNGAQGQGEVSDQLTRLRAAAPNAIIYIIVPGSGSMRGSINGAVTARRTGGDLNVHVIDAGVRYQDGLSNTGGAATEAALDRVHYRRRTNARLGGEWIRQMQRTTEPRRFTVVAA